MSNIEVINLGMVNVFLLKGDHYIMIDTGLKKSFKKILVKLDELNIKATDIKLIILTHSHTDHTGSVKELVSLTGAKLLMHKIEYECGKGIIADEIKPYVLLTKLLFSLVDVNKKRDALDLNVDILVDASYDLKAFGVKGKIIHTPGHTKGSISVLLDSGEVIIGDNLVAMMPWSRPGKPILGYDIKEIKNSIQTLIDLGAKQFYLSHGKIYNLNEIEKTLMKL